jgi:DNA-binding transcriptional MerR regulator
VSHFDLAQVAEKAGVTPRTVRYYQAAGLLPAPERVGRRVAYGPEHLVRLRKISELQDRGLRLESIREVLEARSNGQAPAVALLGPELASESWLDESSRQFTAVELAEFIGERNLGLVGDLQESGYLRQVETEDGPRWQADDLPLLLGALQLAEIGTAVSLSGRARDLLRRRLRRMAEDLVRMWVAESGNEFAGEATSEALLPELDRIRAVAWQSTAHIMAQEINRAVSRADELAAGRSGTR